MKKRGIHYIFGMVTVAMLIVTLACVGFVAFRRGQANNAYEKFNGTWKVIALQCETRAPMGESPLGMSFVCQENLLHIEWEGRQFILSSKQSVSNAELSERYNLIVSGFDSAIMLGYQEVEVARESPFNLAINDDTLYLLMGGEEYTRGIYSLERQGDGASALQKIIPFEEVRLMFDAHKEDLDLLYRTFEENYACINIGFDADAGRYRVGLMPLDASYISFENVEPEAMREYIEDPEAADAAVRVLSEMDGMNISYVQADEASGREATFGVTLYPGVVSIERGTTVSGYEDLWQELGNGWFYAAWRNPDG